MMKSSVDHHVPVRVENAGAPACTNPTPDAPGPPGLTSKEPRRCDAPTVALYRTKAMLAVFEDVEVLTHSNGTERELHSKPVPHSFHDSSIHYVSIGSWCACLELSCRYNQFAHLTYLLE